MKTASPKTILILSAAALVFAIALAFWDYRRSGSPQEIGHLTAITKGSQQFQFSRRRQPTGWSLRFESKGFDARYEQCRTWITVRRSKLSDSYRRSGKFADDGTIIFTGTLLDLVRRDQPWSVPRVQFPEDQLTCIIEIEFDPPERIPCDIQIVAYSPSDLW